MDLVSNGHLPSSGVQSIADERARQVSAEGWTPEHDDEHDPGVIASAAACYAVNAASVLHPYDGLGLQESPPVVPWWPWDASWWKPKDPRSDLVRAGALIAAEIDKLDRKASNPNPSGHVRPDNPEQPNEGVADLEASPSGPVGLGPRDEPPVVSRPDAINAAIQELFRLLNEDGSKATLRIKWADRTRTALESTNDPFEPGSAPKMHLPTLISDGAIKEKGADREQEDALRWRWWRANHMQVGRDEPGDWTCWVEIPCIPFRSQTTDPDELTDALIARFPLNGKPPADDAPKEHQQ